MSKRTRRTRSKTIGLLVAFSTPGFMMYSCSGQFQRDLRDAAISGAANWVSTRTFDSLQIVFPDENN